MPLQNEFTGRERDVLRLLLQAKSNKQISVLLHISRSTVEFHLGNIYRKLSVSARAEAILKLSEDDLWKSTGLELKGNMGQSIGENGDHSVYSSSTKPFFDPGEEKAMKNRITISIILSFAAILIASAVFAYVQIFKSKNIPLTAADSTPASRPTSPINASSERSRGVLEVPAEASTRAYDEVLLLLRTPDVPFHYAAVFAGAGCFAPDEKMPCAFTGPIPYTDGERPDGPTSWRPDGEYGFYVSGSEILVLDHLERVNGKSDVLVPQILITQAVLHLSPDGRWLVESVERGEPYASDLVLIKPSSGSIDKLAIGLEECYKTPLGWLTPSKFLFRCDVFAGATSKKNLADVRYYTYDVLSEQLLQFLPEMSVGPGFGPDLKTGSGFGSLSPNGKYVIFAQKQGDLQPGALQVKDLLSGRVYPLNIRDGQIVWSHDSSKMAIFADNGDIYVCNYDGSNQKKIYSSNAPGYLSMEWFPDDKHIVLVGSPDSDPKESEMIVLSINGGVVQYDPIPATDGYNIVGVSPLPAINRQP